jgi:hypothetical protein
VNPRAVGAAWDDFAQTLEEGWAEGGVARERLSEDDAFVGGWTFVFGHRILQCLRRRRAKGGSAERSRVNRQKRQLPGRR